MSNSCTPKPSKTALGVNHSRMLHKNDHSRMRLENDHSRMRLENDLSRTRLENERNPSKPLRYLALSQLHTWESSQLHAEY